jgi:hypothetical protein
MAGGKSKVKPSSYRDGQNVIRDGRIRAMVYLPPEAKDVPLLTWKNYLSFPSARPVTFWLAGRKPDL